MSSIGTGYDLSAAQFSPDGRVFQVEYAQKAVENSGTAIGLRGKDGVVFAVEKLITSKLHERSTCSRIFNIDKHVGMAVGGLLSDSRRLVQIARDEAADYRNQYGHPIPIKYLQDRLSAYMHAYTLYSAVRPFGASVLLASYEDSPALYMCDPSGNGHGFVGCAVGKAKQNAKTEIEKLKLGDCSMEELAKEAAKIIYTVHDEVKDKNFELEMSWVGKNNNGIHQLIPEDIRKVAMDYAKASIQESDSEDEEM